MTTEPVDVLGNQEDQPAGGLRHRRQGHGRGAGHDQAEGTAQTGITAIGVPAVAVA
jgi:hypothetical protein